VKSYKVEVTYSLEVEASSEKEAKEIARKDCSQDVASLPGSDLSKIKVVRKS